MDSICVLVGQRNALEQRLSAGGASDMFKAMLPYEAIDRDYELFLGQALDRAEESFDLNPDEERAIRTVREDLRLVRDDKADMRITLYNGKAEKQSPAFALNDLVASSAGEYLYPSTEEVEGEPIECKTLELYVITDRVGGC